MTVRDAVISLLQAENIPAEPVMNNLDSVYEPLAAWVHAQYQQGKKIIGISGAQGSGKSTLCKLLALLLQQCFGKSVVRLSLDDFYLTYAQRTGLAESVHPLLQTRGVPGTHDVGLAMAVLTALANGTPVSLPRFDKGRDDRVAENEWLSVNYPVDIILLEGWCVGATPQTAAQLQQPVNALEAQEDAQGLWRQYVNARLASGYQELFGMLDVLVMLKVPSFEKVHEWRALQESSLQQGMNAAQLQRFIMHYQRLTHHMLIEMPQRADLVLQIGEDHQVSTRIRLKVEG
ncbi:MAG: D-glycerate 3-kinase [Pseudomonadota bacterium]|nr:D-glycerate 3-kinase [Pseudomonadota bacterium]